MWESTLKQQRAWFFLLLLRKVYAVFYSYTLIINLLHPGCQFNNPGMINQNVQKIHVKSDGCQFVTVLHIQLKTRVLSECLEESINIYCIWQKLSSCFNLSWQYMPVRCEIERLWKNAVQFLSYLFFPSVKGAGGRY